MVALTIRQREILRMMCEANQPTSASEIAASLNLTVRQVNYSLLGIRAWLKSNKYELIVTPGAGVSVSIPRDEVRGLFQDMSQRTALQVILSVSQRQQCLALFLLTQSEPVIVSQLEQIAQVSRMTLIKDLDKIEGWLMGRGIVLVRKPHFGIQVSGAERSCQQALAEVLWNETPFSGDKVAEVSHGEGLVFLLHQHAGLNPLSDYADKLLGRIKVLRAIGLVAKAEDQLGGRFTDNAVLHLALMFAILSYRVQTQHHQQVDETSLGQLQGSPAWEAAVSVASRLSKDANATWKEADTASIAMELLSAPRNDILASELNSENGFSVLVDQLMDHISQAFEIVKIKQDRTLRNGLVNNIAPACYRQRFQLWFPEALNAASLPEQPEKEQSIAQDVARMVNLHSGVQLPQIEVNNIVALLRAAYIRNRTYPFERVIVVCPSGMATAQLLVARIKVRFPYLNTLEVISLRDLTPALVSAADLILTTVPLPRQFANSPKAIQVHPLLMPEDIEAITQFLS